MASNKTAILGMYADSAVEENRFDASRTSGMEPYFTKKCLDRYVAASSDVVEIGCGTGYYGLYLADKCRSYLGVDLTPAHIESFDRKIRERGLSNVKTMVGDAVNLDGIGDAGYDLVLTMGPMYHLLGAEREQAVRESKCICKKNGIVFFAYINKMGAYLHACFFAPAKYPNANATESVFEKGRDDLLPDVFFFTSPEEMTALAEKNRLEAIKHVGLGFTIASEMIDSSSDQRYEEWLPLLEKMNETPSCVGMCEHALMICRNV